MLKNINLLIALLALAPAISFGNSCIGYYQPTESGSIGSNYTKVDLVGLSSSAANNLFILDLTPVEIGLAKKKLEVNVPGAEKIVKAELKTFEQAIERLRIPEVKAAAWSKQLVDAKFIFGPYHQSIWLTALNEQSRLSQPVFAGASVKLIDRKLLESMETIFSKAATGGDLEFRNSQIETQNNLLASNLYGWANLSGAEKNVRYERYTQIYPSLPMTQNDFFRIINTLSEIWESPKGPDYIKLIVARSTDGIYSLVRSQNKSIANRVVPFLASSIPAVLTAVAATQGISPDIVVPVGVLSGFSSAAGIVTAMVGPKTTSFYHASSLPHRWILRRRLVREIKDELKANDEAIVAETLREQNGAVNDSRIIFSMIRDELQLDILANPVALSLWGQRFTKGLSALMAQREELDSRFNQIVGNADTILVELQKGQVDQKSVRAKEVLNQISRESLYKLLIDLEATKIDVLALSMALDSYLTYLERLRSKPVMSTSNLAGIVEKKRTLFQQNQTLLAGLSTKTRHLNDMAVQTMGLIFELDQMMVSDGLSR